MVILLVGKVSDEAVGVVHHHCVLGLRLVGGREVVELALGPNTDTLQSVAANRYFVIFYFNIIFVDVDKTAKWTDTLAALIVPAHCERSWRLSVLALHVEGSGHFRRQVLVARQLMTTTVIVT